MFLKTFFIISMLFGQEGLGADDGPVKVVKEAPADPILVLTEPDLPMVDPPIGEIENPLSFGIVSPIIAVTDATHGATADSIVGKVQAFYKKTRQLTAKFRQTYTNKTFGRTSTSDGRVWIKKPGKMRWDYKGKKLKVEKSFISDGKMLWAIEHNNRQYFKKDLEENLLPVAVTFLYGKGDLRRDFVASLDKTGKYGKKGDFVLKLLPRKPSAQYKTLYLVVDPGNYRVKQSIVIEASGNINHFRFYEPNTTKLVKDSYFYFNEKKFRGKYRLANPVRKK